MRALGTYGWRFGKIGLLVLALVVAAFSLAQDERPASAVGTTAIVVSDSNTFPDPLPIIFIYPSSATPRTVYVWADNVKDSQGVAAFEIYFTYDTDFFTLTSLSVVDTAGTPILPGQENLTWLGSTGRQVICLPPVWDFTPPYTRQTPDTTDAPSIWEAQLGCFTDGDPPPFGPQGDGLLASITLQPVPLPPPAITALNLAVPHPNPQFTYKTWLIDTTVGEFPTEIPAAVPIPAVQLVKCADMDGDGQVSVPGDILPIIFRYGTNTSTPGWDPKYDLNNDGAIDVVNDILGAIFQYGTQCTQ